MWWGQSSENQRGERTVSSRAVLVVLFIAIAAGVMSSKGWSWGWWMLFPLFFFVIPMIRRYTSCDSPGEKRKNTYEKPKRTMTRDDGEMLEVIEEAPLPRKNPDDIEYV